MLANVDLFVHAGHSVFVAGPLEVNLAPPQRLTLDAAKASPAKDLCQPVLKEVVVEL